MTNDNEVLVIQGKRYLTKEAFAQARNIHWRTVDRHREKGLPWLIWGKQVYIPEAEGDAYVASLVVRRNPPRRRKAIATSAEINGAAI